MADDLPYIFLYGPSAAGQTTARNIIMRAARRLGIVAGEEPLSAADLNDGLQLLNDMMHGFGPAGIKYAHTSLALGDAVNMPDEQLRNLVLMMCKELAMDFGVSPNPVLAGEIVAATLALQAYYWVQPPADSEPMLTWNGGGGFDIRRVD